MIRAQKVGDYVSLADLEGNELLSSTTKGIQISSPHVWRRVYTLTNQGGF
ncbi:hypothetical protein ACFLWC_00735 [Chloroflexota bacterium]